MIETSQQLQVDEIRLRDDQATHYLDDIRKTRGEYWINAQVGLVLHHLKLRPGMEVYDAGAGVGMYSLEIAARYPAASIYAVDFSPGSVSILQEEARRAGHENVRVDVRDIVAYEPPPESFDRALTADVLQHLPGHDIRLHAVRNIYNALRPGGIFVTVNYRWGGWIAPPGAKEDHNYKGTGLYRYAFTELELAGLLREVGFRDVEGFGVMRIPRRLRHRIPATAAFGAEHLANRLGLFRENAQYAMAVGVK
jgi:SAM-dependent methyltransferase